MPSLFFITHPEVVVDPAVPVPQWSLSELGRARMERFAASGFLAQVSAVYASGEIQASIVQIGQTTTAAAQESSDMRATAHRLMANAQQLRDRVGTFVEEVCAA